MREDQRHHEPTMDVERAGPAPPSDDDLAASAATLFETTEPADGVRLIRFSLADGVPRDVARTLLSRLSDSVTVVGSTLPDAYDPANPELDVIVETEHGSDAMASTLANVDIVDGVVVAEVTAGAPEADREHDDETGSELEEAQEGLSIYRLDDHLVVTDDFGALLERFQAELGDGESLDAVEDDVENLARGLGKLADRVESLEAEVDDVAEDAAEAEELESLWYHIDAEVPSREELEYIFAPAAERVDGEGNHPNMTGVVAEVDRELRRTHQLRESGLLGRLHWLLTGDLPGVEDGE